MNKQEKEIYQNALEIVKKYETPPSYQESKNKYLKGVEARKRAREKFDKIRPAIEEYVKTNLKTGDIIKCKGYRGEKEVVRIENNNVIALCGNYFIKKGFRTNGAGSETHVSNVTEMLIDGKFRKIKDLI